MKAIDFELLISQQKQTEEEEKREISRFESIAFMRPPTNRGVSRSMARQIEVGRFDFIRSFSLH